MQCRVATDVVFVVMAVNRIAAILLVLNVFFSNVDNADERFYHTIDSFGAINFEGFGQEATTNAPVIVNKL